MPDFAGHIHVERQLRASRAEAQRLRDQLHETTQELERLRALLNHPASGPRYQPTLSAKTLLNRLNKGLMEAAEPWRLQAEHLGPALDLLKSKGLTITGKKA